MLMHEDTQCRFERIQIHVSAYTVVDGHFLVTHFFNI